MLLVGLSLFLGVICLLILHEWIMANICLFRAHRWEEIYEYEGQKEPTIYCRSCGLDYSDIENDN